MNVTSRDSWQDAACVAHPDFWFADRGTAQAQVATAKSMCNGTHPQFNTVCPHRAECLEMAMVFNDRHGVWGGLSERDRYRERQRRKAEAAALEAPPAAEVEAPPPAEVEETQARVIDIGAAREARMDDKVSKYAGRKKSTAVIPTRAAEGQLARWGATKKQTGRLLPSVQRHLLTREQDVGRHQELIHVSELAKSDWCPRATYLRIKAARAGRTLPAEAPHFQLDNIFEEGTRIHDKWQSWYWDMGVLWGKYYCHACGHEWWETSPKTCANCDAQRGSLKYNEVPMQDPDHLLTAHADGEIRDGEGNALVEFKSIGLGTVRVEQPSTVAKYTRKVHDEDGVEWTYLDHDALWRDLRRPFPSHLRQGTIYLWMRMLMTERYGWPELKKIVFIYEYKATQAVKEFPPIGPDHKWVEEALDACRDIVFALERGYPPMCRDGRRVRCAACTRIEKLENERDDHLAEPSATTCRGDHTCAGTCHCQGAADPGPAIERTWVTRRPDRPARPRADGAAVPDHSLGGLLGRSAGDGVRRRAHR